jgi:hypothetical protein
MTLEEFKKDWKEKDIWNKVFIGVIITLPLVGSLYVSYLFINAIGVLI